MKDIAIMEDGQEARRRFPRVPVENKVLVRDPADTPRAEFAETNSVGLGGCGFRSELPLEVDQRIELLILVDPLLLKAKARVAYTRPLDDGGFDVGVEFVELKDKDREVLEGLLEAQESNQREDDQTD